MIVSSCPLCPLLCAKHLFPTTVFHCQLSPAHQSSLITACPWPGTNFPRITSYTCIFAQSLLLTQPKSPLHLSGHIESHNLVCLPYQLPLTSFLSTSYIFPFNMTYLSSSCLFNCLIFSFTVPSVLVDLFWIVPTLAQHSPFHNSFSYSKPPIVPYPSSGRRCNEV